LRPTAQKQHYKFIGATSVLGKQSYEEDGENFFTDQLDHEDGKDWVEWHVEEQDIYLV
jgi:hypothetical protein